MFDRAYQWSMRHGSRLLFAIAAVLLLGGIADAAVSVLDELKTLADGQLTLTQTGYEWRLLIVSGFGPVQWAVWPMIGALVVDRLDRLRASRIASEEVEPPAQ